MNIPKIFQKTEVTDLETIIVEYPFASLVTHGETGLAVDHIPLFLDTSSDKLALQGHIAKANPLWKNLKDGAEVLVVFHGPNCYISTNHYPTKQQTGRAIRYRLGIMLRFMYKGFYLIDSMLSLNLKCLIT